MKTYLVGIGGEPRENHIECDDIEEARDVCMGMARDVAVHYDIDPDTVSLYENMDGEQGACPMGDDGAYWPHIEIEVEDEN